MFTAKLREPSSIWTVKLISLHAVPLTFELFELLAYRQPDHVTHHTDKYIREMIFNMQHGQLHLVLAQPVQCSDLTTEDVLNFRTAGGVACPLI